jgi:hypothetical protein
MTKKFIATASNTYMPYKGLEKLDYTSLSWEVPEEMVGEKLIVMFRSVNFTQSDNTNLQYDRCVSVYIEA